MLRVFIATGLFGEIAARAAASPGYEVCGLLLGRGRRIEAAPPARNVAAEPRDAFEVDPAILIAALREERAGGLQVLGHYHSHPGGSSAPSARDLDAAEPGRLWLILGEGSARLWLATEKGFVAQALACD